MKYFKILSLIIYLFIPVPQHFERGTSPGKGEVKSCTEVLTEFSQEFCADVATTIKTYEAFHESLAGEKRKKLDEACKEEQDLAEAKAALSECFASEKAEGWRKIS